MENKNIKVDYVFEKSLTISENSLVYNQHTWSNNTVNQIRGVEKFYQLVNNIDDFTVLDVGAQSGAYTLMSKFFPKTKWYSFEPDPMSYSCLLENIELNQIKNVVTKNIALNDNPGIVKLNIFEHERGLNTIGQNFLRFHQSESKEHSVESSTIDFLFSETKVDLIKIDTEGCELNILKGAKNVIDKYKPKIFLEYYNENLLQFGFTISDLDKLIIEMGYKIIWRMDENIIIVPE